VRTLFASAAFALFASQAVALSCIQPDVNRSFNGWVESEDTYYIGVGALTPIGDLPEIPSPFDPANNFEPPEPVTASYLFSGELLDGELGQSFEMPITVRVTCIASWCGNFPQDGTEGLMALRGAGVFNLTLDMNACPGSIFPADTRGTVNACMRSGRCGELE